MLDFIVKHKMVFFDRKIILSKNAGVRRDFWRQFNRTPLQKAGVIVMSKARQSIRRAKPGGKPSKPGTPPRSRQAGSVPPFKQIFSVPSQYETTVTVGMIGYNSGGTPTPALHEHGLTATRYVFDKSQGRGRSNKRVRRTIKYPARPFMAPALAKTKAKLPELWRGSIR